MQRRDKLEMIVRPSAELGTEISLVQPVGRSTFSRTAEYGPRRRANRSQIHSCARCVAGILVLSICRGIDVLVLAGAVVHALHESV